MTRQEFEALKLEIQRHQFSGDISNPLKYAVQRAQFKQQQLQQLIAAGKTVRTSKTVKAKVARWERLLKKVKQVPTRFAEHMNPGSTPQNQTAPVTTPNRIPTGQKHPHASKVGLSLCPG